MDEPTIRTFLRSDYARVVAAVAAVCRDRAQAEDAVQEALARAWDRDRRGLSIDSLPAWVTTVAMNITRSAARSAVRRRRSEERAVRPPDDAPLGDSIDVLRAVDALPRRQREAVVVRYFLGYDVRRDGGRARCHRGDGEDPDVPGPSRARERARGHRRPGGLFECPGLTNSFGTRSTDSSKRCRSTRCSPTSPPGGAAAAAPDEPWSRSASPRWSASSPPRRRRGMTAHRRCSSPGSPRRRRRCHRRRRSSRLRRSRTGASPSGPRTPQPSGRPPARSRPGGSTRSRPSATSRPTCSGGPTWLPSRS